MADVVAFRIQRRNLKEWIRSRIQQLEDSLNDNKVPEGEVSGICKYCKYQTKCYNDGEGLITKPLSIPKNKRNYVSIDRQITERIQIEQNQTTRNGGQDIEKIYTKSNKEAV
jgi:hypothetical protein